MKVSNWVILNGVGGTIQKDQIILKAEDGMISNISKDRENTAVLDIASNLKFYNGVFSFKFKTNTTNSGFLLRMESKNANKSEFRAGHSKDNKGFIIGLSGGYKKNSGLEFLELDRTHTVKIEIDGSYSKLYLNDVEILSEACELKEKQIEMRLATDGELIISDVEIKSERPKAFIIMQFTDEFNDLFVDVIKPICEEFSLDCIRADNVYNSTPILNDIISSIRRSELIIVDITPDNPNVYYELGYAHALNKQTILMCDKAREKLPFDISGFRTLFYENSISGKRKVDENLRMFIKECF